MESRRIAEHLEATHPSPPLHLDSPEIEELTKCLRLALTALQPVFLHLVPTRVLSERSAQYFITTREERFGTPLEQMYQERGGEDAWKASEEGFTKITELLKKTKGPFFLGTIPSYADFIYAGVVLFFRGLGSDIAERLSQASGDNGRTITALLDAVEPWSRRDSY